jgi:hypothetical protein
LPARIVDSIPLTGSARGEDNVRARAVLKSEAHRGALLIFENPALGV